MQKFFANDWPARIWFKVIPLLFVAGALVRSEPSEWVFSNWRSTLGLLTVIAVSLLLGYACGLLLAWPILGSLYYSRELKNSGPFKEGDQVLILTGPHKGRITHVYSKGQGNTVRIELSEQEKKNFKDIFRPTQLLRVDNNRTPVEARNADPF